MDPRRENIDRNGAEFQPQGTFYSVWRPAEGENRSRVCVGEEIPPGFADIGAWIERFAGDRGALLPNLDPENDPATWSCVKRDLADAMWGEKGFDPEGLIWLYVGNSGPSDSYWKLIDANMIRHPASYGCRHFVFETLDVSKSATALAMARVALREVDIDVQNG